MGPPSSSSSSTWESSVLGLQKSDLFTEGLKLVGGNMSLQRLHMEYSDLLKKKQEDAERTKASGEGGAMEIEEIFS